jgi:hypothetical protein
MPSGNGKALTFIAGGSIGIALPLHAMLLNIVLILIFDSNCSHRMIVALVQYGWDAASL